MGKVQKCLLKSADLSFDIFSFLINLGDVITDIAICVSWYRRGMKAFFWLAITDFFISQVAYSFLFSVIYGDRSHPRMSSTKWMMVVFTVVFPISQLVPFIIWFQSYEWGWLDRLFEKMNLRASHETNSLTDDPLKDYIKKKMKVHGGFIIESLVESVPQSILQMIAIVNFQETHWIDVLSLGMSIVSIASRGFLLSYSLDIPTFIFNFMCFVADVLSVFCMVSWLFFAPTGETGKFIAPFLPSMPMHNIYSLLWLWQVVIIICVAAVGGVLLLYAGSWSAHKDTIGRSWRKKCELFWVILGMTVFALLLSIPGLVVVEAMALSFIPLLVMQSLDNPYARAAKPYKQIFAFLKAAESNEDFNLRKMCINRVFATQWLTTYGATEANHWTLRNDYGYMKGGQRYLQVMKVVLESNEEFRKLQDEQAIARPKQGFGQAIKKLCADFAKNIKEGCTNRKLETAGIMYIGFVCVPVFVLTSLYNLLYPFLCFFHYQYHEIGPLQKSLSLALFACLCIIILLLIPVNRFRRLTNAVQTFDASPTIQNVRTIEQNYQDVLNSKLWANAARYVVFVSSVRATQDTSLSMHIRELIPTITKLAGLGDKNQIDLNAFANSRFMKLLVSDKNSSSSSSGASSGKGQVEIEMATHE